MIARPGREWSAADVDALRAAVAQGRGDREIAAAIGRSVGSVEGRRKKLGLCCATRFRRWSEEEDRLLRDGIARKMTFADLVVLIPGRSRTGIRNRCAMLSLNPRPAGRWSEAELAILRDGVNRGLGVAEIATRLPNRTPTIIAGKISSLGLKGVEARAYWKRRADSMGAGRSPSQSEKAFAEAMKKSGGRFADSPRAARPEPRSLARPELPSYRSNLGWAA